MKKRSYSIIFYPLTVCALILFVFWQQTNTPDPLHFISPTTSPGTHPENAANPPHQTNPDALRPSIQLHPEDHIHRAPTAQHLDWTVTADYIRPDGVLKRVYLINGLFPGPTIEAQSGDTLVINVTNALHDVPFTIHWHGLHIANPMDGVASVTQCAISPGSSFIYNVSIPSDQSGTFWYHAHAGLARADGLYGGLVVHAPASGPSTDMQEKEKDMLLLIGDWYHQPAEDVMKWYMQPESFGNEPVPDSLLVNGEGSFNCSMAVPARPVDCVDQNPITLSYLHPGEDTYRVRIVNTGSLTGFTLAFENMDATLIAVDSIAVDPLDAPHPSSLGVLYPGQRMDVLLRSARQASRDGESALKIDLDEECFKYPNLALTPTQIFPLSSPPPPLPSSPLNPPNPPSSNQDRINQINIHTIPSPPKIQHSIPPTPSTTAAVYTKIQKLAIRHNAPYGFFNGTSWQPQREPPVPLAALPRDKWDENQFGVSVPFVAPTPPVSPSVAKGKGKDRSRSGGDGDGEHWVDLVVNNLDDGGHPFHLHGHHFYILTTHESRTGWGSFNPFSSPGPDPQSTTDTNTNTNTSPKAKAAYDLSRAMLRDTVYIPRRGHAVLRFRADNPGVWLFHCHILWHLGSGMGMLVDVGGYNSSDHNQGGGLGEVCSV